MSGLRQVRPSGRTILVVDDQAETLAVVRLLLEREGHRVVTADSGPAALELLEREPVQVLLVDYFMPLMNGEELIARVRERNSLAQIVLQTGYAAEHPPREMLSRLAIQGFHDKGDRPERLLLCVDTALKAYDQLAQLHVAERLKTQLLANVSHEFRTPLNVIVGYLELMREGTFGACAPETAPVFEKVLGNVAYLLTMIDEFLDLAKLEAGATTMRRQEVALGPFLRELAESFTFLVRTKPVDFVVDLPDDLPPVAVDGGKLRIIIQNLLCNAEKFTARGRITLAASCLEDGRMAIHVRDTGPGIAPEHHEAIFAIFHQLGSQDGETQGAGLGLALARRFARMMGGDVTVTSTVGEGSTFTLMLPVRPVEQAGSPHERAA